MVYIPGFLVSRVYERGSLSNTENGFQFNFTNRMTPLRISGMRDVTLEVDGCPYPPDRIGLELGGRAIGLEGGSFEDTVTFAKELESRLTSLENEKRPALKQLIMDMLSFNPRPAYREEDPDRIFGTQVFDLNIRWKQIENTVEVISIDA